MRRPATPTQGNAIVFTTTPQFDAIRARADVSRRASVCSTSAWHHDSTRPHAVSAAGIVFVGQAIVPSFMGNLGYPTTDAKHIGRRPGAASP